MFMPSSLDLSKGKFVQVISINQVPTEILKSLGAESKGDSFQDETLTLWLDVLHNSLVIRPSRTKGGRIHHGP